MSLPQLFVIVCLLRVPPASCLLPVPLGKAAHTHNSGHTQRGGERSPLGVGHTRDQRQHQHQRLLVSGKKGVEIRGAALGTGGEKLKQNKANCAYSETGTRTSNVNDVNWIS